MLLFYIMTITGLFYSFILKSIPFSIIPENAHSVRKTGDSAPLMSSDWMWSPPDSEKGRRRLLSVLWQTPDEPRYTWMMHEVIWKSCIKSLSCDYLTSIFLKCPSPLAITLIYLLFVCYALKTIAIIFLTHSAKFSIWKAIKRYPQIVFCERLNFLIAVVDKYEATSQRRQEKEKEERKKSFPTFCQALYSIMSYDEKQVKRWKNKKAGKFDLTDGIGSN